MRGVKDEGCSNKGGRKLEHEIGISQWWCWKEGAARFSNKLNVGEWGTIFWCIAFLVCWLFSYKHSTSIQYMRKGFVPITYALAVTNQAYKHVLAITQAGFKTATLINPGLSALVGAMAAVKRSPKYSSLIPRNGDSYCCTAFNTAFKKRTDIQSVTFPTWQ